MDDGVYADSPLSENRNVKEIKTGKIKIEKSLSNKTRLTSKFPAGKIKEFVVKKPVKNRLNCILYICVSNYPNQSIACVKAINSTQI
jgi:hypothetical protein